MSQIKREFSPDIHMQPPHKVELIISNLLRIGVISSLSVIVLGTIVSFVHHPDYLSMAPPLHELTRPGAAFPHTLHDVAAAVLALRGQGIVVAGLILLIATPVMRVAVSVLVFIIQRDGTFVIITLAVLAMLLASFLLGKAGG